MTSEPPRWGGVWALPADSGCGACAQAVQALHAPRYAALLRAQGIRFARSPRHADIVLLTGALSAQARDPLGRLLAAVPQPRALVAVGNCAINGCVFRGSATLASEPAEALDVNVELPGCPPAPAAIVEAIAEARHLLVSQPAWPATEEQDEDLADVPAAAAVPPNIVDRSERPTSSPDTSSRQSARRATRRQGGTR